MLLRKQAQIDLLGFVKENLCFMLDLQFCLYESVQNWSLSWYPGSGVRIHVEAGTL